MPVIQFRRGEPASLKLPADSGTVRLYPVLDRAVSISAPSDSPQHDHAARLFEPSESGNEIFVCTDALASAHGIYAWVAICLAVECAGAILWAFT